MNNSRLTTLRFAPETLDLFRNVLEADLTNYANQISRERSIPLDDILKLIPRVLETPLVDKLGDQYRDTSRIVYKKDLDKFTIPDLKEIAKKNSVKTSGTKQELVDRIADHLELKDISQDDIKKSKSFISKQSNPRKKKSPVAANEVSNIIYDSD